MLTSILVLVEMEKTNMNLVETLLSRKSHNKLVGPAPSESQVKMMMQVALRAPDHAQLRPWRYQIYSGESLNQLSKHFVNASLAENSALDEVQLAKIANKPLRAPMVIVASVIQVEHRKVPPVEQLLSAGASVQNLLMAAHFMQIGAIWRTGGLCFNRHLMSLLGFTDNQSIVGFIYLGQEQPPKRPIPVIEQADYVKWQ